MRFLPKLSAVTAGLLIVTGLVVGLTYGNTASATVPGNNTLLNQDSSGTYGNGALYSSGPAGTVVSSGDGGYTAFTSSATNLIASDTNGSFPDVFVRDNSTGTVTLESKKTAGTQGSDASGAEDISNDGRYVLVGSFVNLDTTCSYQYRLYVRDRTGGTTKIAGMCNNTLSPEVSGGISSDGRYVAYSTEYTGTGGATKKQMYIRDLYSNTLKILSVSSTGTPASDGITTAGGMNCSGNIVAFTSSASNLPGNSSVGTRKNLFLAEIGWGGVKLTNLTNYPVGGSNVADGSVDVSCDGNTLLYGVSGGSGYTLHKYSRLTGADIIASVKSSGTNFSGIARSSISGDGRFIAFTAVGSDIDSSYSSTDAGTTGDVYIRDTKNNTTQLVTFTVSGYRGGRIENGPKISISDDGSKVSYGYTTPDSSNATRALISGLTTGIASTQADAYISDTGF